MTQLVTIQQAARDALAAWLTTELSAVAGLVVQPRWFSVDVPLPAKAISIIDAGPRRIEWTDPEVLATTVIDAKTVEGVWAIGDVQQRVQLDVWAQSDVELDDLVARLDTALNARARGLGIANVDPVGAGLLLNLPGLWAPGIVDFAFDEPDVDQTADSANQAEWRATYRGAASMRLTAKAISPRLARIALKQRLSESDAASVNKDVMTVSATGETYTTEP